MSQLKDSAEDVAALRLELAKAQLELLAVGVLVCLDDAIRFLDVSEMLDSSGRLDVEQAQAALSALVGAKPYLAPSPANSARSWGRSP